jgi:hypothetical protein
MKKGTLAWPKDRRENIEAETLARRIMGAEGSGRRRTVARISLCAAERFAAIHSVGCAVDIRRCVGHGYG